MRVGGWRPGNWLGLVLAVVFLSGVAQGGMVSSSSSRPLPFSSGKASSKGKSTSPSGGSVSHRSIQGAHTGSSSKVKLSVEKVYLKGCNVGVVVKNRSGRSLSYGEYKGGRLFLVVKGDGKSKSYSWSLAQVDPRKRLTGKGGQLDFDTGVTLSGRSRIEASIKKVGHSASRKALLTPSRFCTREVRLREVEGKAQGGPHAPRALVGENRGTGSHLSPAQGGKLSPSGGPRFGSGGRQDPRELQGGEGNPAQARGREVLNRDRQVAPRNRSRFTGQNRGSGGQGLSRQGQGLYGPSSPGGNNLPQGGQGGPPGAGGGMGGHMPHRTAGANVIGGNEKGWNALKSGDKEAFYSFLDSRTGAQKGADFREEIYERAWERASGAFQEGDEKKFNQIVEETVSEYMQKEEGVKDKGGDDKYSVGKKGYSNPERLGEKRGSGTPWSAHGSSAPEHRDEATGVQRSSHSYVPWDASQKKAHEDSTPGGGKVNAGTRDPGEIKSGSQGAETMYRMKTYARDPALGQGQAQEQMEGAAGR